ncbi:MAG: transporter [Betaproteobacteria bacterium HGW-Betaproteobacteria-3]|jgi:osmotically-inducible protein OsmY|nr:MAG: transporter [Betaproteobacteria bacterium HGW-Betaproteobacteria-3]
MKPASRHSSRHSFQRITLALAAAATVAVSLSACLPLLAGGAVGGTLMAIDRRTSGTQVEDEGIELRSASRIRENVTGDVHINVTSYNRQVLLTGEVPNEQTKQLAQQVVSQVDNVRSIVNELGVEANSSLATRSSDTLITGKVKATLVDTPDLFANAFKVVTERGTVYLMGRVTQREADRVADVVRGISGVKRVVRVLEIISEEELQRLVPAGTSNPPAPAPAATPAAPAASAPRS